MPQQNVRTAVVEVMTRVLAVDGTTLAATGTLSELPTFNSFRVVEIVEKLESRLDVELDPADLTRDNLYRFDAICELFERTAARALVPGGAGDQP
jgi:acyl carrier protein